MAATTLSKIAKKMNLNIVFHQTGDTPVSLSTAADLIVADSEFSRKEWLKKRNEIYGYNGSAGSKMENDQIVASMLSGYLGKLAHDL